MNEAAIIGIARIWGRVVDATLYPVDAADFDPKTGMSVVAWDLWTAFNMLYGAWLVIGADSEARDLLSHLMVLTEEAQKEVRSVSRESS